MMMSRHILPDVWKRWSGRGRERTMGALIQELKAAERERREDDVHRLNRLINDMRIRKAGVTPAALTSAVKE